MNLKMIYIVYVVILINVNGRISLQNNDNYKPNNFNNDKFIKMVINI